MTTRKPLVHVTGDIRELPLGDELESSLLAALTQVLGYTPANILEVEAANKAARVVYQPHVGAQDQEINFSVNHYAAGAQTVLNAATTFTAGAEVVSGGNTTGAFLAILRKMTVSACTSALTGARVGVAKLELSEVHAMVSMGQSFLYFVPPVGTLSAPQANDVNFHSLDSAQDPPQIILEQLTAVAPAVMNAVGIQITSKLLGHAIGGAPSAIGTNIPPTTIFDHMVNGPYLMPHRKGFSLCATYPAAGTSQSVQFGVSLVWDEWHMKQPVT